MSVTLTLHFRCLKIPTIRMQLIQSKNYTENIKQENLVGLITETESKARSLQFPGNN